MALDLEVIWVSGEEEYFCGRGWTRLSRNSPSGKSPAFRLGFCGAHVLNSRPLSLDFFSRIGSELLRMVNVRQNQRPSKKAQRAVLSQRSIS